MIDQTHDPELTSWVASAQAPDTDFPIQNLPFGVFRRVDDPRRSRIGVAIGTEIFDLAKALEMGLLDASLDAVRDVCAEPMLNALMSLGRPAARALRQQLSLLLCGGDGTAPVAEAIRSRIIVPRAEVTMQMPVAVGDFTDFYASIHHATNVGALFRPDNPLLLNYKWVPIGYHGRSSSLVISGTRIPRPHGQRKSADQPAPTFGPSQMLDYELELGALIGAGNALGTPVPIADASQQMFGLCLVNDWSARDLQSWEYQPLGPFLSKSFATTLSPWVVTIDALEPFRAPRAERASGDPAPLDYLESMDDRPSGAFDVTLDVSLSTTAMRRRQLEPVRLARSSAAHLYWTFAQLIAHHTSNGCNLRPGDLLASGTVSGPNRDSLGCLLELTKGGRNPLTLPTGEQRSFLHDGDEVALTAHCAREGAIRIGFGECRGRVMG